MIAVAAAGTLAVVAGCMDSQPGKNHPGEGGEPNPLLAGCQDFLISDEGKIYRLSVDGGSPPTELVSGLSFPFGLALDGGENALYFADNGTGNCTGSIQKISADAEPGTPPEIVASNLDQPISPVIFGGYLYFSQYRDEARGSIIRVDLDSGEKQVLLEGLERPFGLAMEMEGEDTRVYSSEDGSLENDYTDGSVIKFLVHSDGSVTDVTILAAGLSRPLGLAMDSKFVYIVEMDGGRVFRMTKDTGGDAMPEQEVLMSGLLTPYPPKLDGGELYFAEFNIQDENAGKIYKISGVDSDQVTELKPSDCGTGSDFSCTLLAESLNWPMAVTLDETRVFWTEIYSPSIKSVKRDGTSDAVAELASGAEYEFNTSPWLVNNGTDLFFGDLGNVPCCFSRF